MFGYLKVYKPELKFKEYEVYKAYYCTLCKTLRKRYGLISALGLNYDTTFLALVFDSLKDENPCFNVKRCTVNPLKKCGCVDGGAAFEFAADVSVILAYYKALDEIADSGFFKRLLVRTLLPIFKHKRKKSLKYNNKELDKFVSEYLVKQTKIEKEKTDNVDLAAEPTSELFSHLTDFILPDDAILSRFGRFLGRWVYLMDAFDDIQDDKKSGNYNVFLMKYKEIPDTELADEAYFTLNMTLGELVGCLDKIEFKRFNTIIENIIRDSMTVQQEAAREKVRNFNGSV